MSNPTSIQYSNQNIPEYSTVTFFHFCQIGKETYPVCWDTCWTKKNLTVEFSGMFWLEYYMDNWILDGFDNLCIFMLMHSYTHFWIFGAIEFDVFLP